MNYGYYETHHGQDLIDTRDKSFVYVNIWDLLMLPADTRYFSVWFLDLEEQTWSERSNTST